MQWAARIREWKQSGLSSRLFAEGKPFRAKTLSWWSTRLRKMRELPPKSELRLVPVRAPQKTRGDDLTAATLYIELRDVRVGVRHGFDADLLRKVIAALTEQQR